MWIGFEQFVQLLVEFEFQQIFQLKLIFASTEADQGRQMLAFPLSANQRLSRAFFRYRPDEARVDHLTIFGLALGFGANVGLERVRLPAEGDDLNQGRSPFDRVKAVITDGKERKVNF